LLTRHSRISHDGNVNSPDATQTDEPPLLATSGYAGAASMASPTDVDGKYWVQSPQYYEATPDMMGDAGAASRQPYGGTGMLSNGQSRPASVVASVGGNEPGPRLAHRSHGTRCHVESHTYNVAGQDFSQADHYRDHTPFVNGGGQEAQWNHYYYDPNAEHGMVDPAIHHGLPTMQDSSASMIPGSHTAPYYYS
jgi:hypothetical protein